MPALLLGPLLRYVSETEATVWVETDGPCEVTVLGRGARTFRVEDRHYALVALDQLAPGGTYPYEVALDGDRAWPPAGSELPPSVIRTIDPQRPLRLVFGSCRAAAPHEPPWTRKRASDPRGYGVDALRALALRMQRDAPETWPDALALLGDQLYADQPGPRLLERLRARPREPGAPEDQLQSFDEYAEAYDDAWGEPHIRWLLSTVPSTMIFDDHEIHDMWNTSRTWLEQMRAHDWYRERVVSGLSAYWLYQHLGNLSPAQLEQDELLAQVRAASAAGGDGAPPLRAAMADADRQTGGSRWSCVRELGRTRLVVLDSRAARELEPGARRLVNADEWAWLERAVAGDYDHLLLATSVPAFMSHGLHHLEAWSEAVCDGAWGRRLVPLGERARQGLNLDHWGAYARSFRDLAELLEALARGRAGARPRSVTVLSGEVHHCYLARVDFPSRAGEPAPAAPVWQAVCSGLRKQLDPHEKVAMKVGNSRLGTRLGTALARAAGVPPPPVGWRFVEPPLYANQVATLELDAERVELLVETTKDGDWRDPRLTTHLRHDLLG